MLFITLPSDEPVQLKISGDVREFLLEQGKKFNVSFDCVDTEGKLVSSGKDLARCSYTHTHTHTYTLPTMYCFLFFFVVESGRSFEVRAAVKKNVTPRVSRSKSRLHQTNSQLQILPDLPEIEVPL